MKVVFGNFGLLPLAYCAHALTQIHRQMFGALPSLVRRLLNLVIIFLQKHLDPVLLNPFGSIKFLQGQPGLENLQNICNCHFPVQGSILQLFQTVLSPHNGPMLLSKKPSHSYFLPLGDCTKVGLPHPFGKLLLLELHYLQADWGFAFGPAQVRQVIDLIICIVLLLGNI